MGASAPEVMPPFRETEVIVRAGIDEQIHPAGPNHDTQRVGVPVRRERSETQFAAIEDDADAVACDWRLPHCSR